MVNEQVEEEKAKGEEGSIVCVWREAMKLRMDSAREDQRKEKRDEE